MWFGFCSMIYDYGISFPLTRSVYLKTADDIPNMYNKPFTMLDIGCGTGLPLFSFLKRKAGKMVKRVLAIDINQAYINKATETLADFNQVEVKYFDWMKFSEYHKEKFDLVFFGFSFMLMPNKSQALKQAKDVVTENGNIMLYLTLYEKHSPIMEWLKPKIRFITSIDFGDTIYIEEVF